MLFQTVDIREATTNALIVSCAVVRVDSHHDFAAVDVVAPDNFMLPTDPISVVLYADGEQFGWMVLDQSGLGPDPGRPGKSPYFKTTLLPRLMRK